MDHVMHVTCLACGKYAGNTPINPSSMGARVMRPLFASPGPLLGNTIRISLLPLSQTYLKKPFLFCTVHFHRRKKEQQCIML
jgi:hypothetical protein